MRRGSSLSKVRRKLVKRRMKQICREEQRYPRERTWASGEREETKTMAEPVA